MNRLRTLAVVASGLLLPIGALQAQSVGASEGLGAPLEALDARTRALGGVGIGLRGDRLVPTDPASVADLILPALTFSLQTSWVDVDEAGTPSTFTATRFPVLGVAYPLRGIGVATLSFGSVMDQGWLVQRTSNISLGGDSRARVTDQFYSEGGVSALRLGFARRISPTLAVGATVGSYTGDVTRAFTRSFDSVAVETSVPDFNIGGQWRYSGFTWSAGLTADLGEVARFSASYTRGGDLEATPSEETDGGADSFAMSNDLRVGASALLAPELSLNAGILRSDWASVGDRYDGVTGYATTTWGTGLEFTGARLLGKPGALRLGYRSGGLPFGPTGADEPSENMYSAGIGLALLQSGDITVASSDFTLERGSRTVGSISEEFWRFALSVRVSGF